MNSTARYWRASARVKKQASRRRCSISVWSLVWATSMSARRCIVRGCRPNGRLRPSRTEKDSQMSARCGWLMGSSRCCRPPSRTAAPHCATTGSPTANSACSSIISASMTARASRAARRTVAAPSNASCKAAARRFIVRCARSDPGDAFMSAEKSHQNIIVEQHDKVGLIRLNRPQALNALNAALMEELARAVDEFELDDTIACMVITGSDKAFAAGADIKEMADKGFRDVFLGDFAADNAKFGQPEIKLGIIPGIGGTQRLTHAVGKAKAMDLILTGRMMDAAEAER